MAYPPKSTESFYKRFTSKKGGRSKSVICHYKVPTFLQLDFPKKLDDFIDWIVILRSNVARHINKKTD